DYDANSRVIDRVDPNGNLTGYHYDALDRCDKQLFADLSVQSFHYNADSQLSSTTDPNGTTLARAYDALGRQVEAFVAARGANVAGTGYQAFVWDGLSRLTLAVDDNGGGPLGVTVSRTYDSVSRLLRETQQTGVQVTRTGVPDGSAQFSATPGSQSALS